VVRTQNMLTVGIDKPAASNHTNAVVTYFAAVFLSPGKDTSLAFPAPHEKFHFFGVHPLRLLSVSYTIRVFQVDSMLV